jgi:ornithine cyclodeaminase/alanine dehydrogenase-like protein (mu-crystallin family)
MRCLSDAAIRKGVPLAAAVQNQREAFVALEQRVVQVPERVIATTSHGTTLFKPFLNEQLFGLKVVSVRSGSVPGVIMLFDSASGLPSALMNATYLTALRTAAGSAVACDLLCERREKMTLTVFGSGLQAEMHVLTFASVRSFTRVNIVNRSAENGQRLAEKIRSELGDKVAVEVVALSESAKVRQCVAQSHCVVTATNSKEALFDGAALQRGTFVAAVGSYTTQMRELDDTLIRRATIVADDPAEVLRTSGDFVSQPPIVSSLGALLLRGNVDQFADSDVRLFKSVGTSVQDLFIASLALSLVQPDAQSIVTL